MLLKVEMEGAFSALVCLVPFGKLQTCTFLWRLNEDLEA